MIMEITDKKRPWRESKKSWIFYIDQIKKDSDMVYGETDGIMFFLDCETAQLSVWSEKLGVFTDVGISNFLQRMSGIREEREKSILEGTHIFYKGIELKEACRAEDTELLEFIDIKRELGKKYINISRNGFNEEGERFFSEKLYPGIMNEVQKALKELEKQTEFKEKICKIIKKKCDEYLCFIDEEKVTEKRQELVALIGTVSVLSYLAMRDEWDVSETLGINKFRNAIWNELLEEIDEILISSENSKLLRSLLKTSLFGIPVYSEGYTAYIKRGERYEITSRTNFLRIFLKDRHWAILQCRKNIYSPWVLHLILLRKNEKNEKKDIFHMLTVVSKTEEDIEILENWGEQMCKLNADYEHQEFFFTIQNNAQQVLLTWMLKNIPTLGLFCNEQGNVRLNVLSGRIYPSIFLNKNFKQLILERMMDKAEHDRIQRFSTFVWQGREQIGLKKLPFAVYFIKRGYLSAYSYHKCIVPLDGEILVRWKNVLISEKSSLLKKQIADLLQDMDVFTYFAKMQEENIGKYKMVVDFLNRNEINGVLQLSAALFDLIFLQIEKNGFELQEDIGTLLSYDEDRTEKWRQIYFELAQFCITEQENSSDESMRKLKEKYMDDIMFKSLCSAWLYCCIYRDKITENYSEIKKEYEKYTLQNSWRNTETDKRIVEYIGQHQKYHLNKDIIKASMVEFKEELIRLAQDLEMRQTNNDLNKITRRYRFFTDRLISSYNIYMNENKNTEENR